MVSTIIKVSLTNVQSVFFTVNIPFNYLKPRIKNKKKVQPYNEAKMYTGTLLIQQELEKLCIEEWEKIPKIQENQTRDYCCQGVQQGTE